MGSIKKTETGSVLNFNTYLPKTLDETKISFTPKQSGSGTPSPENVREIVGKNGITVWQSGKNLLNPNDADWGQYTIDPTGEHIEETDRICSGYIPCNEGDTFTFSGSVKGSINYVMSFVGIAGFDKDKTYVSRNATNHVKKISYTVPNGVKYIRVFEEAPIYTNITMEIWCNTLKRQLEIGSEATAYEPFTASVETSVSFPAVGKNLFDISKANIEENGIVFGGNNDSPKPDGSLYLEAGTYTASFSGTAFLISASRSNSTVIKSVLNSSGLTFTLEETQAVRIIFAQKDADDMTTYQYQLEKGSTATAYEPFDNTIYGGYVDLVNGEVVAEWTKVDMGDLSWAFTWNTFNTAPSNFTGNGANGTPTEVICDIYPSDINAPATEVGRIDKNIRGRANYKHICIRDDDYTTAADFKTAVTGHYLAYKLAEPIHYPLSPRILSTLKGNNVMWSDGDSLTISYTDDVVNTYDFRRHISLDTPHKASASGAVASFGTDMVGKMKCKIHFTPKQEGSGTPSPDNVRDISGRSSVKLWQSGKNIYSGEQLLNLIHPNFTKYSDENGEYGNVGTATSVDFPDGLFKENTQYTFILKTYSNTSNVWCYSIIYTDGTETNITFPSGVAVQASVTKSGKTVKGIRSILRSATRNVYYNESGVFEGACTVDDFEPYKGLNEITFSWGSDPEIGTIYGGYVDCETADLVVEYQKMVITGDENWQLSTWTGNNGVYLTHRETSYDTAVIPFMAGQSYSNMLMDGGVGYYNRPDGSFGITGAGTVPNYTYLFINNSAWGTTVEEYKAKLKELYEAGTPLTIVAPLKTAYVQHYSLTPQSIATLRGSNRLWSDGDSVEVEYYKHTDEPQEYLPIDAIVTNNGFVLVTSDGYAVGETNDYIKY